MGRKARVVDRRSLPSIDPERRGKTDVVILYQVDTLGQYSIVLPEETASPECVQQAIRDEVKKRDELRSQEFEVE